MCCSISKSYSRAAVPVLPFPYDQVLNGEQLFLYDRGVWDICCILVFARNQAIQLLANFDNWFSDDIFKFSPEIFFQLYTIHAKIHQRVLSTMYFSSNISNVDCGSFTAFTNDCSSTICASDWCGCCLLRTMWRN